MLLNDYLPEFDVRTSYPTLPSEVSLLVPSSPPLDGYKIHRALRV
jgi:hypothetical protein